MLYYCEYLKQPFWHWFSPASSGEVGYEGWPQVSGKEELWGATLQGREWTRNIQGNIHRFFGEAHKSAEPRGPERIGGCWSSGRS